jgi:ATP-binding cassette subfamily F protein uup
MGRSATSKTSANGTASTAPAAGAAPRRKLGYAEQRELDALPERIAALEAEQKVLGEQLADPQHWQRDPDAARAGNERYAQIEAELLEALERWEALESRRG